MVERRPEGWGGGWVGEVGEGVKKERELRIMREKERGRERGRERQRQRETERERRGKEEIIRRHDS